MPLLIGPTTTAFITVDELKSHVNIPATKTEPNAELAMFAGAAQEAVEFLVGAVLHRPVTETVKASSPAGHVFLREAPILSVQSVTSGGLATAYDFSTGVSYLTEVRPGAKVTVTYTVGRALVPDSIRVATLIIAGHLWDTQRGTASPSPLQQDDTTFVPGLGYAIPNRALDLLAPYLLVPAVG